MEDIIQSLTMYFAVGLGIFAGNEYAHDYLEQNQHGWYKAANIMLVVTALVVGHSALNESQNWLPAAVCATLYSYLGYRSRKASRALTQKIIKERQELHASLRKENVHDVECS